MRNRFKSLTIDRTYKVPQKYGKIVDFTAKNLLIFSHFQDNCVVYPLNSPVETDSLRYRGKALVNGEEFELFETKGSFLDVGTEN